MRVLLVTGKGGVGKTSVAAATAAHAAAGGARTLLVSTDPAHSLADALDAEIGDAPTALAPRLEAVQVDARRRLVESWEDIRAYLVALLRWGGLDEVAAEELALLPGLDVLFALAEIRAHVDAGAADLLVVDCAPTAETLRLLSLPDVLGWYLERGFDLERTLARVVRPMLGRRSEVPLPDDAVVGSVTRLYQALERVRDVLLDTERTSVRLVCTPERVVIAETRRTHTALGLFGYHVDGIVVNRVLPPEASGPYLDAWRQAQERGLAAVREGFTGVRLLTAPLLEDEPIGVGALAGLGARAYDGLDPAARLSDGEPLRLRRDGDEAELSVALPFAERDEVDVFRRADELYVAVDGHTRSILLPQQLRRARVVAAGLADGRLDVRFAVPDGAG